MSSDTKQETAGQEPKPVAKQRVRKPKQAVQAPLTLGVPTTIDGAKDITLIGAVNKRYEKIQFYAANAKAGAQPVIVIHDTTDPKRAKFPGAGLQNFLYALINATMGGTGLSPDGSTIYVDSNAKKVLAHTPQLGTYVIELVPSGRAGITLYRGTVNEFIALASQKAKILRTSLIVGRTMGRKTREAGVKAPKSAEVTF